MSYDAEKHAARLHDEWSPTAIGDDTEVLVAALREAFAAGERRGLERGAAVLEEFALEIRAEGTTITSPTTAAALTARGGAEKLRELAAATAGESEGRDG